MRYVFLGGLSKATLLLAAVALLPVPALGQGMDSDQYQLRRLAGHGLYTRDYPAEAFFILEELGDNALTVGDTAGAIQAYHDAAWIAGQAARGPTDTFNPRVMGYASRTPKRATAEGQRVLEKAVALGGSDTPDMAPLTVDRDLQSREVGLEIGYILDAIGRPQLSALVFEILGDEALERGDADFGEKAYRAGWAVAHEEYLRLDLNYNVRIPASQKEFVEMQETSARLLNKANSVGG
jgi:hypothetical protein